MMGIKISTNSDNRNKQILKYGLIALIFLYPFLHTFVGIDLGDTGYHLYSYENLYKTPELLGFTPYFTLFVGWLWLKIFPGLGLWGLNVLEVIIEMIMAVVVYKTMKSYLGEIRTLIGLLLAIIATDTYLNIFNYHQFNVLWLVLILCCEFIAITKEKKRFSLLAGVCFAAVVFSRMGSITAIVTCGLYVYWYLIKNRKFEYLFKHIGLFLGGFCAAACCFIVLLIGTGQLSYFTDNILRLFGLASSSDGGYSMDNLLGTFISENFRSLISGALYFSGFIILVLGIGAILKKCEKPKLRFVSIVIGSILAGVSIYLFRYAFIVNPVPAWPQMTTAPSFVIGVFYVIAFLTFCYHLFAEKGSKEISLIALLAIGLPLLTIAGSNTGTKHVVLGLWIIAPVAVSVIGELFIDKNILKKVDRVYSAMGITIGKKAWFAALIILIGSFLFRYGQMAYYTMNFDSIDRTLINSQIDSPKLRFLWTTEREADAVNGVLDLIENTENVKNYPLIVYGGSLMFYYLTEMDSYVQPWFTNSVYSNEKLLADLDDSKEKFDNLPIVIYGRTNNYYGFYEEDYPQRINEMYRTTYSGKRDILLEFLAENDYKLQYVNDYYVVLYPTEVSNGNTDPYEGYITGNWE